MVAFEVRINGRKKCIAGIGEPGVVSIALAWVLRETAGRRRRREELTLGVAGLVSRTDESLEWLQRALHSGDEVTIRIIGTSDADPPKKRRRCTRRRGRILLHFGPTGPARAKRGSLGECGRGVMSIISRRVAGQEPQRGNLFIATRPPWDGPNPSGVTCRDSLSLALRGERRVTRQATPLGFVRGTHLRGEAQGAAANAGDPPGLRSDAVGPARLRSSLGKNQK
jgi:hypothetical protein